MPTPGRLRHLGDAATAKGPPSPGTLRANEADSGDKTSLYDQYMHIVAAGQRKPLYEQMLDIQREAETEATRAVKKVGQSASVSITPRTRRHTHDSARALDGAKWDKPKKMPKPISNIVTSTTKSSSDNKAAADAAPREPVKVAAQPRSTSGAQVPTRPSHSVVQLIADITPSTPTVKLENSVIVSSNTIKRSKVMIPTLKSNKRGRRRPQFLQPYTGPNLFPKIDTPELKGRIMEIIFLFAGTNTTKNTYASLMCVDKRFHEYWHHSTTIPCLANTETMRQTIQFLAGKEYTGWKEWFPKMPYPEYPVNDSNSHRMFPHLRWMIELQHIRRDVEAITKEVMKHAAKIIDAEENHPHFDIYGVPVPDENIITCVVAYFAQCHYYCDAVRPIDVPNFPPFPLIDIYGSRRSHKWPQPYTFPDDWWIALSWVERVLCFILWDLTTGRFQDPEVKIKPLDQWVAVDRPHLFGWYLRVLLRHTSPKDLITLLKIRPPTSEQKQLYWSTHNKKNKKDVASNPDQQHRRLMQNLACRLNGAYQIAKVVYSLGFFEDPPRDAPKIETESQYQAWKAKIAADELAMKANIAMEKQHDSWIKQRNTYFGDGGETENVENT